MPHRRSWIRIGAMLAAGAFVLSGCSTPQVKRSRETAASLGDLRALLERSDRQAAELERALSALQAADAARLRAAFVDFDRQLERMRKVVRDVQSQTADLKARGAKYLAVWEQQAGRLANPGLQEMSRERQSEVREKFFRLLAGMGRLSAAYAPYDKDLTDLQIFLGNDTTRIGSEMARPHLTKVRDDSVPVREAMGVARQRVGELSAALSPK